MMSAPFQFTQHALERFIERWGPLRNAKDALHMATVTGAHHVENVPDEQQSIWGFVVQSGPRKGETALMVVSADGTVRTVLPPGSKRPASRRRPIKRRRRQGRPNRAAAGGKRGRKTS